jgi:hypothetical protein
MARRTRFRASLSSGSLTKVSLLCITASPILVLTDARFNACFSAERALATLHGRPIPDLTPAILLILSPYPPTTPHTPLPPPSASPRLVKHLPLNYTDSQLYDLFRPYGALASAHTQAGFGKDTGVVEFWREEDARRAEEALHCTEIEGQNIAVQLYQHRRTSGVLSEFSPSAPPFVPSGSAYPTPYPTQVSFLQDESMISFSFRLVLSPEGEPIPSSLTSTVYPWPWSASSTRTPSWPWLQQPQWSY